MNDPRAHRSTRGRLFLVGLGLAIALVGALFFGLMARSFLRAKEMRSWPEVPCVILTSSIEERIHDRHSRPECRHVVSYGYEWQGRPLTSDRISLRGSAWSSRRGVIEQRVARLPAGTRTTCRVRPDQPDFAVLQPDSLAPGYSIWFPALFVVGGLGIAARAVAPARKRGGRG